MTRKGAAKSVDPAFARGRLDNAKAYRDAADQAIELAEPGQNMNPVLSHIVNAAIGFADAVCGIYGGRVSHGEHDAAPAMLRDVLGNRLPKVEEKRFRRILGSKEPAQYGARRATLDEARMLLQELDAFARWAREMVDARG